MLPPRIRRQSDWPSLSEILCPAAAPPLHPQHPISSNQLEAGLESMGLIGIDGLAPVLLLYR